MDSRSQLRSRSQAPCWALCWERSLLKKKKEEEEGEEEEEEGEFSHRFSKERRNFLWAVSKSSLNLPSLANNTIGLACCHTHIHVYSTTDNSSLKLPFIWAQIPKGPFSLSDFIRSLKHVSKSWVILHEMNISFLSLFFPLLLLLANFQLLIHEFLFSFFFSLY